MATADYPPLGQALSESILRTAETNKFCLSEGKTKVLMATGRRLASKLNVKATFMLNGDKALANVHSASLFSLEIDSYYVDKQKAGILHFLIYMPPFSLRLFFRTAR